jgi:3-hydroxyacyl-CoA dehydrogenase
VIGKGEEGTRGPGDMGTGGIDLEIDIWNLEFFGKKLKNIERIAIVGEGKMGTAIFLYLLGFDFHLAWLCSSEAARDEARKLFMKKTGSKLHCGVMTQQEHDDRLEHTVITADPAELPGCGLIIEAITEDFAKKKALFALLDKHLDPGCIFTSNSSSILPSRLVSSLSRAENFAGMHFFFPLPLKKYVEMVITPETSSSTIEKLENFLRGIQKVPFRQDEENAFLLNRLFLDFQAGAYAIYQEGNLSFREIDQLVKEYFFPSGVFEFFDHVGIDVMLASIIAYGEGNPYRSDLRALVAALGEMKEKGHLGVKTRRGFYDYSVPGSQKGPHPEIKISGEYHRDVISRLRQLFLNSVEKAIICGTVSREFLREAVKDYTGKDESLF